VVASFVVGSEALYRHLDRNPRVRVLRTEVTNDPGRIAANPRMTSINTALSVDLFVQANASRIGARIHSGFGGQTDFIVGALHSPGGQALIALRSWHPKADVSTIVPLLDEPVTSFQHTAVITEQGVAEIHGHDERTQARHLIDQAAHPSVRDELREEAVGLGLA
jgi:acyl-CoA hydrolase